MKKGKALVCTGGVVGGVRALPSQNRDKGYFLRLASKADISAIIARIVLALS
jgi:hypothetical protein